MAQPIAEIGVGEGMARGRGLGVAAIGMACAASMAAEGPAGRTPAELFPDARFDSRIPTQKQVTGIEHGARPLRTEEMLAYLRALDEASPRCRLTTYARSHEGRELVYLAIGDEATLGDLEAFRTEHARRVDPRGRAVAADAALLAPAKAVAWMAYSIHGDELSSADASMALAYRLVAGEDEATARLRRDLLVLVDPCENPDGRDRFLAQTAAFAHEIPNGDSEDLSHTTVWPWGRGNHYLFDLNRDWFSLVHPESRRSVVIGSFNPQLVVDSHEMGADDTYLFSPPRHPFNPYLPSRSQHWHERFAADQARALDAHGFPYYTREWNEEFFPGYGSSWAEYLGSIGILYEMSSTNGTLVKKRDGSTRTYAEAVEHQLTSSWANLTTLAANRQEVLTDFVGHRREVAARAGRDWPAAWVLPRGRHPERTDRLAGLLRTQGIEVLGPRGGTVKVPGLLDARTGEPGPASGFSNGAYLVPLDQPTGALVRQLLDPHIPMEAGFLREEREYLERGRGTRLYEVTAWSLPLAYDVEAYWTKEKPDTGWTVGAIPEPDGTLAKTQDPVAYVVDGTAENAPSLLADLYARGIPVRVAEKPFGIGDRTWPRSSLVVRREGAPDDVERQLAEVAARWSTEVTAVATSSGGEGPDLGGSYFRTLLPPRIGVLAGWPISPGDYGAIWHLLDEVVHVRFNGLDVGRFAAMDLGRYNVLVFPPTLGIDYRAILGASGIQALVRWVEAGGSAVGIGSGAEFLAEVETGLTQARLRRQALATYPPLVLGLGPAAVVAGGPMRADGLRVAPAPKVDVEEPRPRATRREREAESAPQHREGPYDIAPLLGPGAQPFAAGHAQGTPAEPAVTLAEWLAPFLAPGQTAPVEKDLAWADARLRSFSPRGTFVRIELDRDHWLGWGLPAELPALVNADDTLVAAPPVEVAALFADPEHLHLGGLLWPEAAGRLAHTAYVTREGRGRGQVILFLSPPEFRGWTLGTRRLLTNALLYGPGLGTQWPNPW